MRSRSELTRSDQFRSGALCTGVKHVTEESPDLAAGDVILPWMAEFEHRFHPEEHKQDVVFCLCGFSCPHSEETREMVQCDQCMNWQHLDCIIMKKEDLPFDYFCHICLPETHSDMLAICQLSDTRPSTVSKAYKKDEFSSTRYQRLCSLRATERLKQAEGACSIRKDKSIEEIELEHDLKIMKELQFGSTVASLDRSGTQSRSNLHVSYTLTSERGQERPSGRNYLDLTESSSSSLSVTPQRRKRSRRSNIAERINFKVIKHMGYDTTKYSCSGDQDLVTI